MVLFLSRPAEERLVIVYERPKGKKLSVLIANSKNRPSFDFICQYIISPMAAAVQHMATLGFAHGCINTDNIYFDEFAMLGPCVAEPCGLAQPYHYEPLERMQAIPSGKGEAPAPLDYYAMAVVIMNIIYGPNHFNGLTQDNLIRSIMKEGAFNALSRQKDMPEVFYDFFRGLLSHNAKDRWGAKFLKAWLDGKRYNVLPPPPPVEALRPFEFGKEMASTRRELAHFFFQNWDAVPEVIMDGSLLQWVNISLRNKELSEYLTRMVKSLQSVNRKNAVELDEQIMRLICVLDPMGPIRIKNLSFHISGINTLYAELVAKQSQTELDMLTKFIELSMFQFITEQQRKTNEERDDGTLPVIEANITILDKLRTIIRNNGFGFGVERIYYDLNPTMPCNSPLLAGYYVSNLPTLLRVLDGRASKFASDRDPVDRHVAAFIASKTNMQHDIHLVELEAQPKLAKHPSMIALKLLGQAQKKANISYLPGLTHWLAARIFPSMDVIRSKTFKQKIRNMMSGATRTGSLPKLADLMISSGYARAESVAFHQAIRTFKKYSHDIIYYRTGDMLEFNSQRLGNIIAHYTGLIALGVSVYLSVWRY